MSKAIEVTNVSKVYQLGQFNTGTIGTDLQRWWALKRGKEDPFMKIGETNDRTKIGESDFVWSLKDINFKIQQGETVGIIGKNGAGKSTLLKILSQITGPTTGSIKIKGRVASLLEVGTGFHPELTGRDNVFLSGAIFGMRKKEIERKFDEIVAFSGVERYIDTPVKRYSSGMYVRLAFAVAAHLESEILIVDEVLAVGDAEFQEKCLGKMDDVSNKEGRTILFVSHNITAVKQLCRRGIVLKNGSVKFDGLIDDAIEKYSARLSASADFTSFRIKELDVTVNRISINQNENGKVIPCKNFTVDIELYAEHSVEKIGIEIIISNEDTNGVIFATNTKTRKNIDIVLKEGLNKISCVIDKFNLSSGKYWLGFGIDMPMVQFFYYEKEQLRFEVEETLIKPSLLSTLPAYGHVYLDHAWNIIN